MVTVLVTLCKPTYLTSSAQVQIYIEKQNKMAPKDQQQQAIIMDFPGFIIKMYLWITIFVIVCEYFSNVDAIDEPGLVLIVKKRNGQPLGRCRYRELDLSQQ